MTEKKEEQAGDSKASGKRFVDFLRSIRFGRQQRAAQQGTPCDTHFAQLKPTVKTRRQRRSSEDYQLVRSAN
jgi:hypothetical protein